jgi:hypothetical protein
MTKFLSFFVVLCKYHDPFHIRTPYILYLLKDFQFLYLIVERDIILKNFYSLCKGLYKDF